MEPSHGPHSVYVCDTLRYPTIVSYVLYYYLLFLFKVWMWNLIVSVPDQCPFAPPCSLLFPVIDNICLEC